MYLGILAATGTIFASCFLLKSLSCICSWLFCFCIVLIRWCSCLTVSFRSLNSYRDTTSLVSGYFICWSSCMILPLKRFRSCMVSSLTSYAFVLARVCAAMSWYASHIRSSSNFSRYLHESISLSRSILIYSMSRSSNTLKSFRNPWMSWLWSDESLKIWSSLRN